MQLNQKTWTANGLLTLSFLLLAWLWFTAVSPQQWGLAQAQTTLLQPLQTLHAPFGVLSPGGQIFSSDGTYLYVTDADDDALVVLRRNSATGELTFVEAKVNQDQGVLGLDNPVAVTLSPDSRHVYVVCAYASVNAPGALVVFQRDAITGTLTFVERWDSGVNDAQAVQVSLDGAYVYVAAYDDNNAVVVYQRDPNSGKLSYVETLRNGQNGVTGLTNTSALTSSPDGGYLYVASNGDSALTVFKRNANTGKLTFVESQQNGLNGVNGLGEVRSVTLSPDGAYLYAASQENALAVFQHNANTGKLTFVEAHHQGVLGIDGLDGASAVTVSPDGGSLYVASRRVIQDAFSAPVQITAAVTLFQRNPNTGALTFRETHKEARKFNRYFDRPQVQVSPDGRQLYASGFNTLARFDRNSGTGAVTLAAQQTFNFYGQGSHFGIASLAVSPDGKTVYVPGVGEALASAEDDNIAIFNRALRNGQLAATAIVHDGQARDLFSATDLIVSPDNQHAYAIGYWGTVVAYLRDGATGELNQLAVKRYGSNSPEQLASLRAITISPDGKNVYIAGAHFNPTTLWDATVAIFDRDITSGTLTFQTVQPLSAPGLPDSDGAYALAVSPDGANLYATSYQANLLAVFQRNPKQGGLTLLATYQDGVAGIAGLNGADGVAVSPDSAYVYVTSYNDNAVAVFRRENSGRLTLVQVSQAGPGGVAGLSGAHAVTVSPNGNYVYVASNLDDALVVFQRNPNNGLLTFVEKQPLKSATPAVYDGFQRIGLSPDGSYIYVASEIGETVNVFGLSSAVPPATATATAIATQSPTTTTSPTATVTPISTAATATPPATPPFTPTPITTATVATPTPAQTVEKTPTSTTTPHTNLFLPAVRR